MTTAARETSHLKKKKIASGKVFHDYSMLVTLDKIGKVHFVLIDTN